MAMVGNEFDFRSFKRISASKYGKENEALRKPYNAIERKCTMVALRGHKAGMIKRTKAVFVDGPTGGHENHVVTLIDDTMIIFSPSGTKLRTLSCIGTIWSRLSDFEAENLVYSLGLRVMPRKGLGQ